MVLWRYEILMFFSQMDVFFSGIGNFKTGQLDQEIYENSMNRTGVNQLTNAKKRPWISHAKHHDG